MGFALMPATVAPRWDAVACDESSVTRLADAINVAPIVARLLCQRGFSDPEQATRFLTNYFAANPPEGSYFAMNPQPESPELVKHVIARGETLSGIAERYRVSSASIRRTNSLRTDVLRVGQVLTIPRS